MDLTLVNRCRAGDGEAFGLLFEKYKNLVYRTAYLTLGSETDAEDLLQEVFLQVHRSLATYDPQRGSFSTWLYRVTVNRCLNWRRGRPATDSLDLFEAEPAGSAAHAPHRPAEDDGVRRSLDKLSPKLRVVVVLRYYWDLSYAQIADITELPLGTVKSRLNSALRQMRDDLEPELSCPVHSIPEA